MKPSYQEALKAHLATYKVDTLGVAAEGVYSRNGKPYKHILPAEQRDLNLLGPYRSELRSYLDANPSIELHRDFHHLNSSQAMCLNLFYPAITDTVGRRALEQVLDLSPVSETEWAFEKVIDPCEGTNFDFYLRTRDGGQVFFELKLSESEFGTAKQDERHLCKLRYIYGPRLSGRVRPELLEPTLFFTRYQLFRNLSYVEGERDMLFLVVPKANGRLFRQAESFIDELDAPIKAQVRLLELERIAVQLRNSKHLAQHKMQLHYGDFINKYCI